MMNVTVGQIIQERAKSIHLTVKEYLESNGFDGLFNGGAECACFKEDLFPCGELSEDCEAGYKGPCTCGNGCDWDIYRARQQEITPDELQVANPQ